MHYTTSLRYSKQAAFPLGHFDAFVHSVIDAGIWFDEPIGKIVDILFNEFFAAIRGTSINDNPFEIASGLRDNAIDGALQSFAVVEIDGDFGEFHDVVGLGGMLRRDVYRLMYSEHTFSIL